MENVALTGSDKQIDWATEIRRGWLVSMETWANDIKLHHCFGIVDGHDQAAWISMIEQVINETINKIQSLTTAKQVIDMDQKLKARNQRFLDVVKATVKNRLSA